MNNLASLIMAILLFSSMVLQAQDPALTDTRGNKFDDDPVDFSNLHQDLLRAYDWALANIIKDLKTLDQAPWSLSYGYYQIKQPKKVIELDTLTIRTLAEPLQPIQIMVSTLTKESNAPVVRVSSSSDNQFLLVIGTLPRSYQANLIWDNYLAIDLYDNATVGSYRIISISNSVDTKIMIGSLVGRWGYANHVAFHKIYGATDPTYNPGMRFIGTLNPINY